MEFNFTGHKILVTGASAGIGRALATTLAKSGAEVFALGRNEKELSALAQECGDKIHPLKVDLADWETARAAVEQLPVMDGLVNNAATIGDMATPALDADREDIASVFDINIFGALNMSQIVAKKMIAERKAGSIVNISSVAGISAMNLGLGYALSKTALDMLTKRLALELGPHNIRVNSLSPSWVKTAGVMHEFDTNPEKKRKIFDHMPLRRLADQSEVVTPILYLLSNGSSMVTGTTHVVDGGFTTNIPI